MDQCDTLMRNVIARSSGSADTQLRSNPETQELRIVLVAISKGIPGQAGFWIASAFVLAMTIIDITNNEYNGEHKQRI